MFKVGSALFALFLFTPAIIAQQTAWADKLLEGKTSHDFGVVARGAQVHHVFKITNIYKVPLDITEIRVSCGCVKAEASTKLLQPNESATLTVHMDASKFVGSKTVRIYMTVGPKFVSTATIVVSANARGDVTFSPRELDFGTLQRGNQATRTIEVEYNGSQSDWRVTEIVKNSTAPFELKVEELPRLVASQPRKGYRITATMRGDAPGGAFRQEVVLKTNDPTSPVLTFGVIGNVQTGAGLAVSPSPISVTGLRVGESQTKKIFVRASRPFKVTAVDGQGDGVTVDVPNRKDTTIVLTVNIQATKSGDMRRTLNIRTDLDTELTPLVIEGMIEP